MDDEFIEQARREGKWVLLDFGAEWCSTCKPVEAMLERDIIPKWNHKVVFAKVDVHQRTDLVERYRILSIPTVILCSADDRVMWRKSGYFRQQELEAVLQN